MSAIFFPAYYSPVESVDQQFRQLKEKYEHMTESELFALAQKAYDLTKIAREALQAVITEKLITVQLELEPQRAEYEDLVIFSWPKNAEELEDTTETLAAAGIPSFICLEVRKDDVKRAQATMDRAYGKEVDEVYHNGKDYAILCPKCRSTKVLCSRGETWN